MHFKKRVYLKVAFQLYSLKCLTQSKKIKHTRKNLIFCSKSGDKPSSLATSSAAYPKLSTNTVQLVNGCNNIVDIIRVLQGCSNKSDTVMI